MATGSCQRVSLLVCIFLKILTKTCTQDVEEVSVFDTGITFNSQPSFAQAKPMRYLLYDVNPGEGFNLRRDVYMRIANLVLFLNKEEPWTLVLPPWGSLYHWRSKIDQNKITWSLFFDVESLGKHVPVIEFAEYLKVIGEPVVEEALYLQRFVEGWTNGKWEEKMEIRPCIDHTGFHKDEESRWRWWFWGYEEVYAKEFRCMSIQSQSTNMAPFLINLKAKSVLLLRAEEVIHGEYSEWSSMFWTARRSIVFAKHLKEIGDNFRRNFLNSTDEEDRTVWAEDWTKMRRNHGDALGGPYIAVHLRRQDFVNSHRNDVPTLKGAASQIQQTLDKLQLRTAFVATDAPEEEFDKLKEDLEDYQLVRYRPSPDILGRYKDGGIAIIDQWICAHARFFIGSSHSTFSFRIQEEREILGFYPEFTFNRFCGKKKKVPTATLR